MTKVLLIEDDPMIYRLYEKLFKLEGFNLKLAESGMQAIEQLPEYKPDVILLDIMMPGMNGLELLSKIKEDEQTKSIPVVVLTNISDSNVIHMALQKGAVLALIKSQTEPPDVINAIRGVLKKSSNNETTVNDNKVEEKSEEESSNTQ